MSWRRFALVAGGFIGVAVLAYGIMIARMLIEVGGPAGIHQRAVTREIATWENEYATPHDWREAWRAAEMLEYIATYYVPGEGYRGSERIGAELEAQRARQTREAIASGLREFTGQDFGTDAAKWQRWLTEQGHGGNQPR